MPTRIPVRNAVNNSGEGKGSIRGFLYNDLPCSTASKVGTATLISKDTGKSYTVREVIGAVPAGTFCVANWFPELNMHGVVETPCEPCPDEIICNDHECTMIWSGDEWFLLTPCPIGCECPGDVIQPGPGDFVGQVISMRCGSA